MVTNQVYLFLVFILNGIFIGLLFDFFRILRKSFDTSNLVTYIEDILFWILTGISIIFCMYNFSDGNLRWFMFFGLIFGVIIYMLTLSKILIKFVVFIIIGFKKIFHNIFNILIKPIKFIYKIMFKPINLFLTKISKKINYKLKNTKNVEKT